MRISVMEFHFHLIIYRHRTFFVSKHKYFDPEGKTSNKIKIATIPEAVAIMSHQVRPRML